MDRVSFQLDERGACCVMSNCFAPGSARDHHRLGANLAARTSIFLRCAEYKVAYLGCITLMPRRAEDVALGGGRVVPLAMHHVHHIRNSKGLAQQT